MADVEGGDDASITDDSILWRRVPPEHVVTNNDGSRRPTSSAFDDDPQDGDPMSVAVASVAGTTDALLAGHDGFGVVAFKAGLAREQGFTVTFKQGDYPGHAVVVGKKTHGKKKKLATGCSWVREPGQPPKK